MKTPTNRVCEKCGSNNLRNSRTTFPLVIEGKQMNVGRVSVRECIDCYSITPTKAGLEKIERCTSVFIDLLIKTEKK